jgi:hypothetical protein
MEHLKILVFGTKRPLIEWSLLAPSQELALTAIQEINQFRWRTESKQLSVHA